MTHPISIGPLLDMEVVRDGTALRSAILGLALGGRLIEQCKADEPAQTLLGRLKAGEAVTPPDDEAATLPKSWAWANVGDIADCVLGKMLDQAKHTRGRKWPYLRNINVRWDGFDLADLREMYFEDDELERYGVRVGDVLICEGGEPGRAAVWTDKNASMLIQKAIHRVRFRGGIEPRWLVLNLRYDASIGRLHRWFTGATIQHFTGKALSAYSIRLPPLAEQKRIVAKVDQLMALCDDLEAKQTKKRALATQSTHSALTALTTAETAEDLSTAWQRVAKNFDLTTSESAAIDGLRSAILGLAVRGRLEGQDPRDEPAVRLLPKIRPGLKPAEPSESPFPLPPGWCWSTFADLGEFSRGRSKHRPRNDPKLYVNGKYPFVQTGDVARSGGTITTFSSQYNDVGLAQSRLWPAGTMCITIAANIADTGILTMDACFPDSVVGFIPGKPMIDARFFMYFISTAQERIEQFAPSTAQKNINMEILSMVYVPVPPLAEQKRIVAKVDHLMSLLDDLEAKLRKQEQTATRLAESLAAAVAA